MVDTQTFVWGTEIAVATLEVRHHKFEMLLNVVADVAEKVRAKMAELNKDGMYPNEETTSAGSLYAQFIISGGYNWNSRWRDFKTIINEVLDAHGIEKQEEEMSEPKKDWQQMVNDRAVEIAGGLTPEEGDFNTATIQLREHVPPEVLASLQAELAAVEVGSSVPNGWEPEEDPPHWLEWYDEDCRGCGNPPDFCDCE